MPWGIEPGIPKGGGGRPAMDLYQSLLSKLSYFMFVRGCVGTYRQGMEGMEASWAGRPDWSSA